nr:interferon regulatory factor 3 [Solea senegalensis]XP_043869992.1 interferon regulatory factor 3 [Solea senegalensis]XP_043869993.1 interferon regulatory factor 3 [Solea senegalensis]
MAHSKPLLIPWLRAQIDSGEYPGVQWTNPEHSEFCVPWKHALRQDSSSTDILIFKAWAEVSGNGRAQGEPSVWKRNFRSALRAKGFKMMEDNKNETANPHKVFRWPENSASGAKSAAGSQEREEPALTEDCGFPIQESQLLACFDEDLYHADGPLFVESSDRPDILQQCLQGLNIGHETEDTTGFEPVPEQQQLQSHAVIGGHTLLGQQQYPVTVAGAVGGSGLPEQPACPVEGGVGGACDGQLAEQFLHTMSQTKDGDHFKTQFRITVYYRGQTVMEQVVENEAGFRLVYSPGVKGTALDDESGLTLVFLPSIGIMLDQTQTKLTQHILDKLGDGLEVGVSGHVVYGQRRGEVKAFWSFSKFDQSRRPQEIPKLQPQSLYMFKDFIGGMLAFINGAECPPCSMFLCLGEKWPDPDKRPWEKKLITVEVVLTSMELLKTLAVGNGATSLQSVELQMSLEEMMETC